MSNITVSCVLEFKATPQNEDNVEKTLLPAGCSLVEQGEPNTRLWFGLKYFPLEPLEQKDQKDKFAIIDFFTDNEAIDTHFAGEVPKAVKANEELIKNGLEKGIVANAKKWKMITQNSNRLTESDNFKFTSGIKHAKYLSYIPIKCGDKSQIQNMINLLNAGLGIVTENESKTSFWCAMQNQDDETEFCIIDCFDNLDGVVEHFVDPGRVPAAVKGACEENKKLISGGFEKGVLGNVRCYEIVCKKVTGRDEQNFCKWCFDKMGCC